jgi:hypothetical protein
MRNNYPESNKQKTERRLKRLFEDQEEKGVVWVAKKLGSFDKKEKKNAPTEYTLIFQKYVAEAYFRVLTNEEKYNDDTPGTKWEKAAREVAEEFLKKRKKKTMQNKKREQTGAQAGKQAIGTLVSYGKKLLNSNYDLDYAVEQIERLAATAMMRLAEEFDPPQTSACLGSSPAVEVGSDVTPSEEVLEESEWAEVEE